MDHWLLLTILVALGAAAATGQAIARAGFPIPAMNRRIGCIDGLRGYLALFVMMHHFDLWISRTQKGAPWGASSSRLLENFGPGGVTLFFMTTGLVFYPRISEGLNRVDWRATYISRAFRILPLQLVSLIVVAGIALAMVGGAAGGGLFGNLRAFAMWGTGYAEPPLFGYPDSGLINARVLWSLWQEWMFYLFVLPAMAGLRDLTRSRLPRWTLPVALLIVGLLIAALVRRPGSLFFLPLFASGMVAYELRERPAIRAALAGRAAAIVSGLLLAIALLFAHGPYGLPQLIAYALFFACVASGNSFGGVLAWRGSIVLGECSFGLYLLHGIVLFVLFTFLVGPGDPPWIVLGALPIAAIAAVVASALAHLAIERPGVRAGKWFAGLPRRSRGAVERATIEVAP